MSRRILLHPAVLVFAAMAVGGAIFGWIAMFLVGVLGVAIATLWLAMRPQDSGVARYEIPNEDYVMIRPILESRAALAKLVDCRSVAVRVVGKEALIEADAIVDHAYRLLQSRAALRAAAKSQTSSVETVSAANRRDAGDTLGNRRDAGGTLGSTFTDALAELDDKLIEARALLEELCATFAASIAHEEMDRAQQEQLSGMVQNVRALNASLTEAQELEENGDRL